MALSLSLERRDSSIDRSRRVVEIAPGRMESWRRKTAMILPLSVTQKIVRALELILLTEGSSGIFSQCGFLAQTVASFHVASNPFPGINLMLSR